MSDIAILRHATVPDNLRLARARAVPHLGPRFLFFSGGSALNEMSRKLKLYTHNSAHLITPFDSGGSSQVLREAFSMPAVGDLRSRLMALADETELGQPDIYRLFSHRLPKTASAADLAREVASLFDGSHPLLKALSKPMRQLIVGYLRHFRTAAPKGLDYRNASIGNLILAGGYLDNDRALEPVLFLMSKMVDVRGTVRPIADVDLQIGVELEGGRRVIGQRQMTGKECAPLGARITRLFLSDGVEELPREAVRLPKRNQKLIAASDLICYPPGSLYSSVISNLLPAGVGRAVAARNVPKVYIPSLGVDPECQDMGLSDQIAAILAPLRRDAKGEGLATSAFLTHVICDDQVPEREIIAAEQEHGVSCHRMALARPDQPTRYDPNSICELLISLA
ncbi:GAK system CofD-like protein [Phaeobacter sp. HF9A]|uniref:GAK system CofD-like protein n=1 Tax=Phaeobacter sp. HF9A TaxID=2721561 RepID=UPI00158E5CB6|nr:GAK system CofD-like protein [Phaeobacter sp. HF9A]